MITILCKHKGKEGVEKMLKRTDRGMYREFLCEVTVPLFILELLYL